MKSPDQLKGKLEHLQGKLMQVEKAIDQHMEKPWYMRDKVEMRFLLDEKKAWRRAIECLRWALED
jgi:hypothetical protein